MKLSIKILFLFFLSCNLSFISNLNCQNIRISGVGENIEGKEIRLLQTLDLLTKYEKEIDSYFIKDSSFSFELSLEESKIISLRIEAYNFRFIAQPGKNYRLRILPFNYNLSDSINTLFYEVNLPIIIENENDLNKELYIFDSVINNYLIENSREILVLRNKKLIDSLFKTIEYLKSKTNDEYLKNYIDYSSAVLLYSSRLKSKEQIKRDLFYNKPILYDNLGYMNCFETIYGNYFSKGNKNISTNKLDFWLAKKDYFSIIDTLGIDTLLRNEIFRELVLLQGMKEAYFSKNYINYEVIEMIKKLSFETKFIEHRRISENLINYLLSKSFKGTKAKDFTLTTIEGKEISLNKLSNKPSIISFVKLSEIPSLKELNILHNLIDSLKDNYNIITITCDRNMETTYNFKVNSKIGSKYKWDFIHFDNKWSLLEAYNIKVFPTFILVNNQGEILQNPMKNPSEGGLYQLIPKKVE